MTLSQRVGLGVLIVGVVTLVFIVLKEEPVGVGAVCAFITFCGFMLLVWEDTDDSF